MPKIKVLIVCQWPLGGIRTYLKYNYKQFPRDQFEITILANPSIEKASLIGDMAELGIDVVWSMPVFGKNFLGWRFNQVKRKGNYDIIHSQGFYSAFHVSLFNRYRHIPHIMTVHGIVEPKYLAGTRPV